MARDLIDRGGHGANACNPFVDVGEIHLRDGLSTDGLGQTSLVSRDGFTGIGKVCNDGIRHADALGDTAYQCHQKQYQATQIAPFEIFHT